MKRIFGDFSEKFMPSLIFDFEKSDLDAKSKIMKTIIPIKANWEAILICNRIFSKGWIITICTFSGMKPSAPINQSIIYSEMGKPIMKNDKNINI